MFCSKCGARNPDDAAFCSQCGATLLSATAVSTVATSPAYAAPHPAPSATYSDSRATAFDEEAWRAAIGARNADYYIPRFRAQHIDGQRSLWHWSAFFVTIYWLLHRKLWLAALAYFILPYLLALVLAVALGASGVEGGAIAGAIWLLYLCVIFFAPPLLANSLYYVHTRKLLDRHRAGARSRDQFLAIIEAKGGTSNIAAIIIAIFVTIGVVGILAAVSLPAYQDYTKRAKSSEAILAGMSIAMQVGEQYERTGQIPSSLDGFRSVAQPSKHITDSHINPENGVIEIQVSFGSSSGGGKIYLIPKATDARAVSWSCKAEPAMARFVPQSCREQ